MLKNRKKLPQIGVGLTPPMPSKDNNVILALLKMLSFSSSVFLFVITLKHNKRKITKLTKIAEKK
jgi:hypothetical protein